MANMIYGSHPQNKFAPHVVRVLAAIYEYYDERMFGYQSVPFEVPYGFLTIDENRLRGGSPRSRHMIGEAADIRPSPNTDIKKMVLASVAEGIIMNQKWGSEIAIKWGLNGHVHIAVLEQKSVHKRYPIDGGVAWSSKNSDNKKVMAKIIERYNLR